MALITRYRTPTTNLPGTDVPNLEDLATEGKADGINCCEGDPQTFQAAKTYLLALILKASGGSDYTDWCALAGDLSIYDRMTDYDMEAAYIEMLIKAATLAGVDSSELSEAKFKAALSGCWCCSVTPKTLENMEIFLLYRIFNLITFSQPG